MSLLDLDADGRLNLVHMPDFERYTVFTPVLEDGTWVWSGSPVSAPKGQSIKIDWTRHARNSATEAATVANLIAGSPPRAPAGGDLTHIGLSSCPSNSTANAGIVSLGYDGALRARPRFGLGHITVATATLSELTSPSVQSTHADRTC